MKIAQMEELLTGALDKDVVGEVRSPPINYQKMTFIFQCCAEGIEEQRNCTGFVEGANGSCSFRKEGEFSNPPICMKERINGKQW